MLLIYTTRDVFKNNRLHMSYSISILSPIQCTLTDVIPYLILYSVVAAEHRAAGSLGVVTVRWQMYGVVGTIIWVILEQSNLCWNCKIYYMFCVHIYMYCMCMCVRACVCVCACMCMRTCVCVCARACGKLERTYYAECICIRQWCTQV